jgi:predicted dehydrogenase
MKVAVLGAGVMGKNHARVLQSMEVELAYVVDADLKVASHVARLHGGQPITSIEALGPVDAAIVAVPTQDHASVASTLLERGVHVLIEKPIAETREQALALEALAEAKDRVLMVGHVERFNPAVLALKAKLAEGALGKVFQVRARRVGPFPRRIRDVGVALDLGTHDIDVMRYVLGADVARVFAETKREIHTSREDLVAGLLRFTDDTVGLLEVSWLTPTKARELEVTGERGMFRVDYLTQDLYFFENAESIPEHSYAAVSALRGVSEGAMTRYSIPKVEPLRAELDAFFAACRGDRSRMVGPRDGLAALEVASALARSGQTKQIIHL